MVGEVRMIRNTLSLVMEQIQTNREGSQEITQWSSLVCLPVPPDCMFAINQSHTLLYSPALFQHSTDLSSMTSRCQSPRPLPPLLSFLSLPWLPLCRVRGQGDTRLHKLHHDTLCNINSYLGDLICTNDPLFPCRNNVKEMSTKSVCIV